MANTVLNRIELDSVSTEPVELLPRISARGHLSLVDWDRSDEGLALSVTKELPLKKGFDPAHRTRIEKVIEGGIMVWMATIILAVVTCLAHL